MFLRLEQIIFTKKKTTGNVITRPRFSLIGNYKDLYEAERIWALTVLDKGVLFAQLGHVLQCLG